MDWLDKWDPTFNRYSAFFQNAVTMNFYVTREMKGYQQEEDPEIFNELRPVFVGFIDHALSNLDQEYEVKPVLEDYIQRVRDTKLAELLKEFNAAKDSAPNLVAIGFRTILSLVIQEKAKRINSTSNTATCIDLAPVPMIDRARNDHILSPDEQRFVNTFVSIHSDIYNMVAHRPGADNLVDKSEVDAMVDLLNKLLPAIIN